MSRFLEIHNNLISDVSPSDTLFVYTKNGTVGTEYHNATIIIEDRPIPSHMDRGNYIDFFIDNIKHELKKNKEILFENGSYLSMCHNLTELRNVSQKTGHNFSLNIGNLLSAGYPVDRKECMLEFLFHWERNVGIPKIKHISLPVNKIEYLTPKNQRKFGEFAHGILSQGSLDIIISFAKTFGIPITTYDNSPLPDHVQIVESDELYIFLKKCIIYYSIKKMIKYNETVGLSHVPLSLFKESIINSMKCDEILFEKNGSFFFSIQHPYEEEIRELLSGNYYAFDKYLKSDEYQFLLSMGNYPFPSVTHFQKNYKTPIELLQGPMKNKCTKKELHIVNSLSKVTPVPFSDIDFFVSTNPSITFSGMYSLIKRKIVTSRPITELDIIQKGDQDSLSLIEKKTELVFEHKNKRVYLLTLSPRKKILLNIYTVDDSVLFELYLSTEKETYKQLQRILKSKGYILSSTQCLRNNTHKSFSSRHEFLSFFGICGSF